MHHRRDLASGLGVTVTEFVCRAATHPTGAEEANAEPSVVFVRRGTFVRAQRGRQVVADANAVLFFHPDHPYRIAHARSGGDDCTIFTIPRALEERWPEAFAAGHAPASPRLARLHLDVLRHLVEPRLALDDALAALLDEALRAPREAPPTTRRQRDVIEAARAAVRARPDGAIGLAELARSLGVSPFHLSRTFARVAGVPLRRYVLQLRVREAAWRLLQGEDDLTRLALDLGFFDHAHFTRSFRAAFGVPPSRFRPTTPARRSPATGPIAGPGGSRPDPGTCIRGDPSTD